VRPPRPSPPPGPLTDAACAHPAGVRGTIGAFVTTVCSPSTTYHFYELEVSALDAAWPEAAERTREWVDYAEAIRRIAWKPELAQGLALSTLAPRR
jgi:diphosphoinositol-polyphosphate diphosphatase